MSFKDDVKFYNRFLLNLPFESKKRLYELITQVRKFNLEDIEVICNEDNS